MRYRQGRDERASALMLVPAGVLVLLVLAAIAIDASAILLAQRELQHKTAAVANDLSTLSIDDQRLYAEGAVAIDHERAADLVARAFAAPPQGFETIDASVDVGPDGRTVTVVARGDVPWFFARVVPGARDVAVVEASATVALAG